MVQDTCALCGKEGDLRKSHIIPKFVGKWLKSTSATGFMRAAINPSERLQDLPTAPLLCGEIVYSNPPPMCFGRTKVWKGDIHQLNTEMSAISRVIIHPKYRSIGLGAKLVAETLSQAGTPCVETVAVMAKYNPFF